LVDGRPNPLVIAGDVDRDSSECWQILCKIQVLFSWKHADFASFRAKITWLLGITLFSAVRTGSPFGESSNACQSSCQSFEIPDSAGFYV